VVSGEAPSERVWIRGGRVLDPASGRDGIADVLIENGRVTAIDRALTVPGDATVVDAAGLWVAPGLVDIHTHLREPGQEYKENIASGTGAAAAGGFTTVCAMANTDPINDSPAVTEFIRRRARETGRVRVEVIAAATQGARGEVMSEMAALRRAGAIAFSDDGFVIMRASVMRRVLEYASGLHMPVISHCEDLDLRGDGVVHEGAAATCCGLSGSPAEAETVMVARDLELARLTCARLHIAHVSAARSVDMIRDAKRAGVRVTAEVTPHHLALTDGRIATFDTDAKMAPPLRTAQDREALRAGLADGTLDCVATDHAPHAAHEKDVEFASAPFGVVGLETALPVVLGLVRDHALSPLWAIECLSLRPARVLGLRAGTLLPGSPADVVLIDPERCFKVSERTLCSRSKNSAFAGSEMQGKCVRTFVAGRQVYVHDTDGA
jgi:dihydroorotase